MVNFQNLPLSAYCLLMPIVLKFWNSGSLPTPWHKATAATLTTEPRPFWILGTHSGIIRTNEIRKQSAIERRMTYESRVRPRMGLTTQKARPKSDRKFFEQKFQNIQILYSSLITWPWQTKKTCSEPISRTKRVGTTKQRCFPLGLLRVIQKHHQDSTHDSKTSKLWQTQIFTKFFTRSIKYE